MKGYNFFLFLRISKKLSSLSTVAARIVNFRVASGVIALVRYADISSAGLGQAWPLGASYSQSNQQETEQSTVHYVKLSA